MATKIKWHKRIGSGQFTELNGYKISDTLIGVVVEWLRPDGLPGGIATIKPTVREALAYAGA